MYLNYMFEKCVRKKIRDLTVNYIVELLRLTGEPDIELGYIVKFLHFIAPWIMIISCLVLERKAATSVLFHFFIASGLFIYFKGCFLTVVEYKLCKDSFNIVDPYIHLCGLKETENLRYYFTIGGMILHFIIIATILHFRGSFL